MFPIPTSLSAIILHVLATAIGGAILITFAEYGIHRHVMHRKQFPAWIYRLNPDMKTQFHNHAVLHHGTFYKSFDHEPTSEGKFFNLRILPADTLRLLVVFSPIMLLLAMFISIYSAATLVALIVGHNLLWGVVHVQMHVPEGNRWFRETAYFRFIARHHFMHHQRSGKNYNVVLPLADFILGASTKPRISDVREMLRLGYLAPRTAAGKRRLEAYRKEHIARRPVAPPAPVVTTAATTTAAT